MALRTIRIQGDPVLTKKCREITEITPKIRELAEDMLDTMYEANGVGLAGPQVGVLKRIVVIDIGEGPGDLRDFRRADRRRGLSEPSGQGRHRDQTELRESAGV